MNDECAPRALQTLNEIILQKAQIMERYEKAYKQCKQSAANECKDFQKSG
jgi:hypothetical protein